MQYFYTVDKISATEKGSKPLDGDSVVIWRGYDDGGNLTIEDVATGRKVKVDKLEFSSYAVAVSDTGTLDEMRAEGKTIHYTKSKRLCGILFIVSIVAFIFVNLIKTTNLLTETSATALIGMIALTMGYCAVKYFSARRQLKRLRVPVKGDKLDATED